MKFTSEISNLGALPRQSSVQAAEISEVDGSLSNSSFIEDGKRPVLSHLEDSTSLPKTVRKVASKVPTNKNPKFFCFLHSTWNNKSKPIKPQTTTKPILNTCRNVSQTLKEKDEKTNEFKSNLNDAKKRTKNLGTVLNYVCFKDIKDDFSNWDKEVCPKKDQHKKSLSKKFSDWHSQTPIKENQSPTNLLHFKITSSGVSRMPLEKEETQKARELFLDSQISMEDLPDSGIQPEGWKLNSKTVSLVDRNAPKPQFLTPNNQNQLFHWRKTRKGSCQVEPQRCQIFCPKRSIPAKDSPVPLTQSTRDAPLVRVVQRK